ncbi:MAG: sulfurtransferase TusA family protein [Acidobacteriota bacterium]
MSEPTLTVDATGLLCPLPVLEVERALARVNTGDVVLLLATDEGIRRDLPAWCEGVGHELLELTEHPDAPARFRGLVRRCEPTEATSGA